MKAKRIEITKDGKSYAARVEQEAVAASVRLSVCATDTKAARGIAYRIAATICESGAIEGMRGCLYVEAQSPVVTIETLRGTSGELEAAAVILVGAARAVSDQP